jgi:hypothetical protein
MTIQRVPFLERLVADDGGPMTPVLALLFVSLGRVVLERALYGYSAPISPHMVLQTFGFYLFMFSAFATLLRIALGRRFTQVTDLLSIGLLLGLLPPLLQLVLGDDEIRMRYFSSLTFTLFAEDQALGESLVIWSLIAGSGLYVRAVTRSWVKAAGVWLGAYGIVLGLSWLVIEIKAQAMASGGDAETLNMHLVGAQLGLSCAFYVINRWRQIAGSVRRLSHAVPHVALAFGGAAWVGKSPEPAMTSATIVLLTFLVLLIHNDCYDRVEDQLAGRPSGTTRVDVVWTTVLLLTGLFTLAQAAPLPAMLLLLVLLVGAIYHHPDTRLKSRAGLSYQAEGAWALLAFAVGAADPYRFPEDAGLLVPSLLVFGGGILLSIPKDWKDIASDRSAGIATCYVVLTARGLAEEVVHKYVTAAVVLGMLVVPALLLIVRGISLITPALVLLAVATGFTLLRTANRRAAVERVMWLYGLFIGMAAWALI